MVFLVCIGKMKSAKYTNLPAVNNVNIGADRSEETAQTQIRLLLKEQSDQSLHCLAYHMHLLDALLHWNTNLFNF